MSLLYRFGRFECEVNNKHEHILKIENLWIL